jgi:hypothetical protein
MGFSFGRLIDPIGLIKGVGKGKGSIKNGYDALGLFTKDANETDASTPGSTLEDGRNFSTELQTILDQLGGVTQAGYNLQSQYGSKYLKNTLFGDPATGGGLLDSLGGTTSFLDQLNNNSTRAYRTAAMDDAIDLDSTKRNLNPELYTLMNRGDSLANPRGASANELRLAQLAGTAGDATAGETLLGGMNYGPSSGERRLGRMGYGPSAGEDLLGGMNYDPSMGEDLLYKLGSPLGGRTGLEAGLYDQASADLALGGNLSDSESSQIEQDTRRAFAARGLYDSNAAVGKELMNLDQARQQRLSDRRSFATGVEQLGQQRTNQAAGIFSSLAGLDQNRSALQSSNYSTMAGLDQNRRALQSSNYSTLAGLDQNRTAQQSSNYLALAGLQGQRQNDAFGQLATVEGLDRSRQTEDYNRILQSIGYRSGTTTDPLALINSNPGSNQNNASTVLGLSAGFGGSMPDYLSQILGYGADVANTNFNAASAANIAEGNNSAAKKSATMGAIGTVGGALLMFL